MPTRFHVRIADQAKRDVQAIHDYIAKDKPGAAAKWVRTCHRLGGSLSRVPFRYGIVPEAAEQGRLWREIVFGTYRILFRVDARHVTVLRVVHGAQLLDESFFKKAPVDPL